jgi:hypothetical protein
MSGSVGLGSLVLSLFSSTSSSAASGLLAALYPAPGTTAASTDPIGDMARAEANSTQDIAQEAADPTVARDIAAFRTKVAAATDPATLLQDPQVLKVLLTANGLGDQAQYPALAQKALLSDTTNTNSLADTLSNTAWKATASLYDFANKGLSVLQTPSVIDTLANGYAEVLWRQSLDAKTPGLSEALTFKSEASTISSVDQILGDSTLRSVVTGALGIPPEIAYQSIEAQEKAISSKVDITRFQDPKFVESITSQYLLAASASAASSSSASPTLDQLAASSGGLLA